MQVDDMLSASFQLLIMGMGTVFFILLLLFVCISLMSVLSPEPASSETAKPAEANAVRSSSTVSATMVAVIQAAVHQYRTSSNR